MLLWVKASFRGTKSSWGGDLERGQALVRLSSPSDITAPPAVTRRALAHNRFLPARIPPPASPPGSHLFGARPPCCTDALAWGWGRSLRKDPVSSRSPPGEPSQAPPRPAPRPSGVPRRAPCAAPPRPLLALDPPPRLRVFPQDYPYPAPRCLRGSPRGLGGHALARARTRTPRPRPFHPSCDCQAFSDRLSHPTPGPAPPYAPPTKDQTTPLMPAPRTRAYPVEASPPRWSRGPAAPGRPPAPPSCHPLCVSHPHGLCGLGAELLPGQPLSGGRSRL